MVAPTVVKAVSRPALGRGLSALIGPATAAPSSAAATGFRVLPIERLRPSKDQPRKHFDADALEELAASIRSQGVLQPIVVRRQGEAYEIVAGERRWRAAGIAGLGEVPVLVKELSDLNAMQVALIENIQRADLDPIEEALAYQHLLHEHELRHEDLARAVGKNRVTITNALRLLRLPKALVSLLAEGKLSPGHARPLLALNDEERMVRLAQESVGRGLSVRDVEKRVRQLLRPRGGKVAEKTQGAAATALVERLQRALGTKVDLVCNQRGRGQLQVHFNSLLQLDELVERLCV